MDTITMDIIIEYTNFVGLGLYIFSSMIFFYLFLRTLRTKDGIGLFFLKILTLSLSIGSLSVALSRYLVLNHQMSAEMGRAIAVLNPIALLGVGLYLNYLFHHPAGVLKAVDSKNIREIKADVKEVKATVKKVNVKIDKRLKK